MGQRFDVATDLRLDGAAPDVVAAVAGAAGEAAGAVAAVAGAAIGALEADEGAVPAGVGSFGAWDWGLLPHAESTSAQRAMSTAIFMFISVLLGETTDCRAAMLQIT